MLLLLLIHFVMNNIYIYLYFLPCRNDTKEDVFVHQVRESSVCGCLCLCVAM